MPVTTSAWKAARRAASRWLSKPISRNEVIEVSSQNTNSVMKPSASTSPCMAPMNIRMKEKKRPCRGWPFEVAARKQHDQRADAGDQQREGQRQAVDAPGKVDAEARRPGDGAGGDAAVGDQRQKAGEMGKQQRRDQRQRPGGVVAEETRQERRDGSAGERQKERKEGERLRFGRHDSPGSSDLWRSEPHVT